MNALGVSHGDQKLYLEPVREKKFPMTLPTREDEQIREAMVELWVNFARTG